MTLSASVIICTHDRPGPLRRAADSALAQTRPPAELIVVNDGDGEIDPAVPEAAAAAAVRFAAVRQGRPCLPASRNRGMALARGDVVMLLDDDMVLPRRFLERLLALYEADVAGDVAGIGAVAVEPARHGLGGRLWAAAWSLLDSERWLPRRCAARHVRLPAVLRSRLAPARRLTGGTISLRADVAAVERFDEGLGGYALGEDREFCARVGARRALFLCPSLHLVHEKAPAARPLARRVGRMYVPNMLRIAAAAGGGAGTWLLMGVEIAGAAALHAAFVPLGDARAHLGFLAGMAAGAGDVVGRALRRMLCGC